MDPDLKIQLQEINKNLEAINKKTRTNGIWRSFFNGVFGALGYIVGVAIIVVILGWILQKTGLLPAFREQVKNFSELVGQARRLMNTEDNSQDKVNQQNSGGETIVTLPDGRQVRVNLQEGY